MTKIIAVTRPKAEILRSEALRRQAAEAVERVHAAAVHVKQMTEIYRERLDGNRG